MPGTWFFESWEAAAQRKLATLPLENMNFSTTLRPHHLSNLDFSIINTSTSVTSLISIVNNNRTLLFYSNDRNCAPMSLRMSQQYSTPQSLSRSDHVMICIIINDRTLLFCFKLSDRYCALISHSARELHRRRIRPTVRSLKPPRVLRF